MIYLYICALNYKRVVAYFNKKVEKTEETVEEQEELKLILPAPEEEVASASEAVVSIVAVVSSEAETVVNLEKDVNTWYTIEDGLSRYKGEWKNGLPNGKGIKHYYKTDSYIEGNFVDSFAHGYCKQTFEQTWEKTVPYYEGEFKRNNWVKGEYHYGDGDYYKGEWKDGKYNGQGAAYSLRTNRTWVGEYKNDEKVEGNWVKGELEQIKVEEVQVEEKVEEEVQVKLEAVLSKAENLENDVNTWYKFADGKGRYKGEWKNGLPNGRGTKHSYKDDSYIYGNFVDGFSEGYGKQTFGQTWEKTQPYYEGEFKRNNYHGKGEYHYGDGDYYKGDWKDSKYNGQGAAYSKRLDKTWVGEYENDVKGEGNWIKGEI
jgi:hypothetical protein